MSEPQAVEQQALVSQATHIVTELVNYFAAVLDYTRLPPNFKLIKLVSFNSINLALKAY